MKLILQTQMAECGLACLAMIADYHGHHTDLMQMRRRFGTSNKGMTLSQLSQSAAQLGFSTRPLRLELGDLKSLALPCIVHWDLNHFVVLRKVTRRGVTILDPAHGEQEMPLAEASRHFTGIALECIPTAGFGAQPEPPRIRLAQLTGRMVGLKRSLGKLLAVALVLQLFALASPIFNQIVIDDVIGSHNTDLLTVLFVGFGLLLAVQTVLGLARSWMVMVISQEVGLQWSANVFAHLVRLPLHWFEQRHVGDVASRFASVGAMQRWMTVRVIEAALDGVMGSAALVMMLFLAPRLAIISVGAVAAYALARWAFHAPMREVAAERLVLAAREQSHFMETVRAITPVKLFGREDQRRAHWQNLAVDLQNRDVRRTRLEIGFSTANTFIFGLENLLVFSLGARLVMQGQAAQTVVFTLGMLFAFTTYKAQFTQRVASLIDYIAELRVLGVHAERLADIALAGPEQAEGAPSDLSHLPACLELRNVSFRYGQGEPWVLKDVSLTVRPGEHVAIVGPSGCGKTTLVKVLLGLLPPAEGEVLYGGVPLRQLGLANVRRRMGTVMQEDHLLAGSIADNVSFFDPEAEHLQIEAATRRACIHEEIMRMPMGYLTMIGDLGSGLSGGQKQRLLLARALYKPVSVVILDEATSHLDVANERAITLALSRIELTRLVIAHRPETISGAQRVVVMEQGKVTERSGRAHRQDLGSKPAGLRSIHVEPEVAT